MFYLISHLPSIAIVTYSFISPYILPFACGCLIFGALKGTIKTAIKEANDERYF